MEVEVKDERQRKLWERAVRMAGGNTETAKKNIQKFFEGGSRKIKKEEVGIEREAKGA